MQITELHNREEWDKLVIENHGHPLQLWGWGETKAEEGNWTAHRVWIEDHGGAQILIRKLPKPFKKLAYIPRGPILGQKKLTQIFLTSLANWCKKQGCIELKIESDKVTQEKLTNSLSYSKIFDQTNNWKVSKNRILLNKTVILDLTKSEDELLRDMTKKTRQYINKSSRENIQIRRVTEVADLKKCLTVYKQTAERAGFDIHPDKYYLDIAKNLGDHNQVFVAEYKGRVLSFLWNVFTPETCFELYGGVTDEGQKLRANYILKWSVIKECKTFHVKSYDMNGLLNDGVSNFKLGFSGGKETFLLPTMDKPLSPLYIAWEGLLPTGKKVFRTLKRR